MKQQPIPKFLSFRPTAKVWEIIQREVPEGGSRSFWLNRCVEASESREIDTVLHTVIKRIVEKANANRTAKPFFEKPAANKRTK